MPHSLNDEAPESIKKITEAVLGFQVDANIAVLSGQLVRANVQKSDEYPSLAVFKIDGSDRPFDASRPLSVEARLRDKHNNPLHAIVYVDAGDNLLAIEVFAWSKWESEIDVGSAKRASYDSNGLSLPSVSNSDQCAP